MLIKDFLIYRFKPDIPGPKIGWTAINFKFD